MKSHGTAGQDSSVCIGDGLVAVEDIYLPRLRKVIRQQSVGRHVVLWRTVPNDDQPGRGAQRKRGAGPDVLQAASGVTPAGAGHPISEKLARKVTRAQTKEFGAR